MVSVTGKTRAALTYLDTIVESGCIWVASVAWPLEPLVFADKVKEPLRANIFDVRMMMLMICQTSRVTAAVLLQESSNTCARRP